MSRGKVVLCLVVAFVVGIGVGTFAAKKDKVSVTPAAWQGKSPEDAAAALLELAKDFAGDGSYENIHVGRVYLMSGQQDVAESIFEQYTGGSKPNGGDLIRIARAYAEAGAWDKAKPVFDRIVELFPDDEDWMVEIGAHYNLNGDRERAEELFARGFEKSGRSLRNTLDAAGSYVGVPPRR